MSLVYASGDGSAIKYPPTQYFQAIETLNVEIIDEPNDRTMVELAQTARPYQLSSYDAVHFDLAIRLGIPLVTDDSNLPASIECVGIEWIERSESSVR